MNYYVLTQKTSLGTLLRNKNKGIYLFILEEDRRRNRERALREKALREKMLGSTEQETTSPQNFSRIPEELCKEETMSLAERIQPASDSEESDFRTTAQAEIRNYEMESLKGRISEPERKGRNLKIGLKKPTVITVCSFIAITALIQLDTMVKNICSHGLQVNLEWATSYWIATRTALGILGIIMFATLFQIVRALRGKCRA